MSYRTYYDRWGYLPPGFEIEIDGKKIIGGCAKWRAHADRMGYPQEPHPEAPRWEHDRWHRFLAKMYRPWVYGDEPLGKMYETDLS